MLSIVPAAHCGRGLQFRSYRRSLVWFSVDGVRLRRLLRLALRTQSCFLDPLDFYLTSANGLYDVRELRIWYGGVAGEEWHRRTGLVCVCSVVLSAALCIALAFA